jgi:gamma-glutamylcyclotransferase (GGCT)/AIG2-like uncharacterized protein YtfP
VSAKTLVFVYGTLKRGGENHSFLANQTFLGEAHTVPGFRLYELDGYPGMVDYPDDRDGVTGELWSVDSATLSRLDELEGVEVGLYRRQRIPLQSPFERSAAETYLYARSVAGRREIGSSWPRPPS